MTTDRIHFDVGGRDQFSLSTVTGGFDGAELLVSAPGPVIALVNCQGGELSCSSFGCTVSQEPADHVAPGFGAAFFETETRENAVAHFTVHLGDSRSVKIGLVRGEPGVRIVRSRQRIALKSDADTRGANGLLHAA